MTRTSISLKSDGLINKNTHNAPNRRICWKKRPCYREIECQYCWNRKRSFITKQVQYLSVHWNLRSFITIGFDRVSAHPTNALMQLAEIRRNLHKILFKKKKYISLIVVEENISRSPPTITPHFHIIAQGQFSRALVKQKTELARRRSFIGSKSNINIREIGPLIIDTKKLAGYLMDQNYRKCLGIRPKGLRLMTASRGFYTGRPRHLEKLTQD